ncbi:ThuA domain-containing protein [Mucilaginibacter sp. UR6-1]|uniref:ThuA domain-containing protein n=1 Tax=Mucilaginibacter sp. UR6-1 TaxID=1435643 RepID=UPI001E2D76C3|nr:ThuA domain-containing protein [Mucilaginibacter sp. UR6-1]MCC8407964.1 ThuA domain-containing protein [Mucilaginibacter sp. UR6-1]
MKIKYYYFALIPLLVISILSFTKTDKRLRVLVFFKTKGYHHQSITAGITAIQKLGAKNGFDVDTTADSKHFIDTELKKYAAVIFLNTTGNVLNAVQQTAFERYIQAGGGFVGVHAAADTEYDWPWYGNLVGAYFESHPNNPNVKKATINITDNKHEATKGLQAKFERTDEWYNYRSFYVDLKTLATLDEATYEGGTNPQNHPISWYHDFDGGRAFYTGMGHTTESYTEPLFLTHLLGGIQYAIGDDKPLDYSKAHAVVIPEQNRFVKTVLVDDLDSPMELAISNDGRIYYTQLGGDLSVYDTRKKSYKKIIKMPITDRHTGLIGIALDPGFEQNHFIYLYYTPAGQTAEPIYFRLSRFTLDINDNIDLKSEKLLISVPVQENSGNHHGGSLAWDKNGNLYLSTGDSTSPFSSNGYSPIDERPGKEYYSVDAQRGAANTNDYKGKILRIHPEPDGSYTIPDGNLFAKGTDKTKPEIFVMGCRNPYRIAVNPKTSTVYWGEIGPDAGKDGIQGPRGYDEFNQAKKAGNFGWPYFVGNNFAYAKWDFATATAGPHFDVQKPINTSPKNTGLRELPPAQPAMIWYPYAVSAEWPELGMGGRCAIGGTFYTYDKNSASPNKFPEYYDGKLFVADWMRNWVMAISFDDQENYRSIEPFMSGSGDFRRPIDMTFGQDGVMYMLEYGSVYGAANKDARLVKIEYNSGNRAPVAKAAIIDSTTLELRKRVWITNEGKNIPGVKQASGQAPLKINFSANGSADADDDDEITYQWYFDGKTPAAKTADASHIYRKPGTYKAILKVTDKAGKSSFDTLAIKVGNTAPVVTIASADNRSFYWLGKPFKYNIKVEDKEDKTIVPARIKAYYTYYPSGLPTKLGAAGQKGGHPGLLIMAKSDCKACHLIDKKAVGPSFIAVANRYKKQEGSVEKLAAKIISGGGGSWDKEHVMSAHPQLSVTDASEIVRYIFSLTDKQNVSQPMPLKGSLNLTYNDKEPEGVYLLEAYYTDKGSKFTGPITANDKLYLRYADLKSIYADEYKGFERFRMDLSDGDNKSYLMLRNIYLNGIKNIVFSYSSQKVNGDILLRIDSQAGPVIGKVSYTATGGWDKTAEATLTLNQWPKGKHDIYFVASKPGEKNIIKITNIKFNVLK